MGRQVWEYTAMSWPELCENKMSEAIEYKWHNHTCQSRIYASMPAISMDTPPKKKSQTTEK